MTLTVTGTNSQVSTVSHVVSVATSGIAFVRRGRRRWRSAVKCKAVTIPTTASAGNTALLFLSQQTAQTWTGPTGVTGWTKVGSYANSHPHHHAVDQGARRGRYRRFGDLRPDGV